MKTSLDCVPCFARQALEAARMVSADVTIHEQILREVLRWSSEMDMDQSPPAMGQRIHRRLREITGVRDPYRAAKDLQNQIALDVVRDLEARVKAASDRLAIGVSLAIAGNVIDLGVTGTLTLSEIQESVSRALEEPFTGDLEALRAALAKAKRILYLADNAGEIVFDRLLIEQLLPAQVAVVVRGAPVINDATMEDARTVGLPEIAEVIDNGSDAPGTILEDCSLDFKRRFTEAGLIIAKGQGNFETLSDERRPIFFLFKVKCPVVASHVGLPVGTPVLASAPRRA
ncbi:MAG: DUF89 family protein [Deltaproteobacteria bacterium]|nr:DUF89 family protein [Deltaproteobacteria bacterium]